MNAVYIDEKVYWESELDVLKKSGLKVTFRNGDNNVVNISSPYAFKNFNITISGSYNEIKIQKGSCISNTYLGLNMRMNNINIYFGENFICAGANMSAGNDEDLIFIGNNCEFGSGIYIATQDAHTIYDVNTNRIMNKGKKVVIGDDVYLGFKTTIMKNVILGAHMIVMPYAVVTKSFLEEYLQIGGNPAVIMRRNVVRKRVLLSEYDK